MTLLSDYETQVADLLHDASNKRWSVAQLDRYINEARRQLVMDSGCLRVLQTAYCSYQREQYTFGSVWGANITAGGSGYTSPSVAFSGGGGSGVAASLTQSGGAVNTFTLTSSGSGYTSSPSYVISGGGSGATLDLGTGVSVNTYDVLAVSLFNGAERIQLLWNNFRDFSAQFRPYLAPNYTRQPVAWAFYGMQGIYLAPVPDQTYQLEVDSVVLPVPLADYVTTDPIPALMQDPIKFYAAALAKFNAQQYGESETFKEAYRQCLTEKLSAYVGRIPDVYGP